MVKPKYFDITLATAYPDFIEFVLTVRVDGHKSRLKYEFMLTNFIELGIAL